MKLNLPKITTALLISGAVIFLASCGGTTGATAGATTTINGLPSAQTKQEVINGIEVPPDPGAAKDATLQGVDTDGNGIRDELDRWIATQYGDKPQALDAIRWSVRSSQKYLTTEANTKQQALALIYTNMDVGGCIWRKLDADGVPSSSFFNEELIRTYNTRERIDARKKLMELAGMISRSTKETTIACPYKK
jgi:hypothetical protein